MCKTLARLSILLTLLCAFQIQAAVISFSSTRPDVGDEDVYSLVGSTRDLDNVGTATADGAGNDATTYIAHDRGAQGQTFVTGPAGGEMVAVVVQHAAYEDNTDNTWYNLPTGGQFTIRLTDPAQSGSVGFVLYSEICTITGDEPNNFAATGITNTATGTGTWVTFTLDFPVTLLPNTTYGLDISSQDMGGGAASAFFEIMGIKDDAADGNPYAEGNAYTSGAAGVPNNSLTAAPGDHVFIIDIKGNPGLAGRPFPDLNATDVFIDTKLSWRPGRFAETHDVYFGTASDQLALVSAGQDANTYNPGLLEYGQTYYWRIDEVNGAPDFSILVGDLWSFTAEPLSIPIEMVTAAASSSNGNDPDAPSRTIDGSGLDGNDGHSTAPEHMWSSATGDTDPWIQYEFDQVYKLDKMLVWNANQVAETSVGWGVKDVQIETSLDGTTWTVIEDVNQLSQAPGEGGAGPTDSIDLGRIVAKYVRISIMSNWGGLLPQYSLSEVRFYAIPLQAREPVPAPGATGILPDALLSWRSGREAASHDVFVSTDANAVLNGSAPSQTVAGNSLDLASLDLPIGETYFWKVNEVNDAEDPSTWEGPVWDFSIPDPLVVDDFESYSTDDIAMRPYVTWRDGLPYSNPAPGGAGNNTGAVVGHDIFSPGSPFFDGDLMELSLIHGGSQSLPLYYDNSGNGGKESYSEMTRTFSPAQDWSGNAITTLTLYFRGMEGNAGQLYVKINDTKILFQADPGAISRPLWEQWNIDLASTGATLSNVRSLTVGIENPGSGLVYVDDIVLYRDAPAVAQGTDPGNAGLVASYSMENNVNDSVGGYDGTVTGTPTYEAGPNGMALNLDGVDDFVELPIGSLIGSLSNMTISLWARWSGEGADWQRLFDFGSDTTDYMFLTPNSGAGAARFALLATGAAGESLVDGLVDLSTDYWHHVAVTIDSSTMTLTLYVDGSVTDTTTTEILPQDLGETTQNWLGDSQFDADPFYNGALDEFLIYNRALSEAEVRYLAGEQ